MVEAIVITVSLAREADGRPAYSTRGQLFDGAVDGRPVATRSTQPLLDDCRALLAGGVDPATQVVVRHAGSTADALRSTVGAAARLTVYDNRLGKPVFAAWKDRPAMGGESTAGRPPMRQAGVAPPHTLAATESLAG